MGDPDTCWQYISFWKRFKKPEVFGNVGDGEEQVDVCGMWGWVSGGIYLRSFSVDESTPACRPARQAACTASQVLTMITVHENLAYVDYRHLYGGLAVQSGLV